MSRIDWTFFVLALLNVAMAGIQALKGHVWVMGFNMLACIVLLWSWWLYQERHR